MVLHAAYIAMQRLFSAEYRSVFWKVLGLTILLLIGAWAAIRQIFFLFAWPWLEALLPGLPEWTGWLGLIAALIAGLGLALVLALLIAPVTALIAGLFLDDIAAIVEREDYPNEPVGQELPMRRAMIVSLKFLCIVIAGNILALMLLLVPGVNLIAFFIINGYLLGREFFEFAAMRYHSELEAKALRSRYSGTIFLGGLVIACFLAVPLLSLLTPLFAATMMVHLHKSIMRQEQSFIPSVRG
ncbi:sulfate transporter family protein [Brucellaceae bacterium C25G]